ncbi:UNVERIFIED_CONTAM: hypothetical protein GTU68_027094 [Idotea baltica]|nr:hypothetical protein [Idotea baltica]
MTRWRDNIMLSFLIVDYRRLITMSMDTQVLLLM